MKPARIVIAFLFFCTIIAGSIETSDAKRTQIFAPRNDLFVNATQLESSDRLILGQLHYGSREYGEPKTAKSSMGRTVWYKYKATITGRAVVAVTSGRLPLSPFVFRVYTGTSVSTLSAIGAASVQGIGDDNAAAVAFSTIKDTEYFIQIDKNPATNFRGDFQIGLRQFDASGGLAFFRDRPSILLEESSNYRSFLLANAYSDTIKIQSSMPTLSPYVSRSISTTVLAAGKTAWYRVEDNYSVDLTEAGAKNGSIRITSVRSSNNAKLGTIEHPFFLVRNEFVSRPSVLVRFAHNGIGVRQSEQYKSRVYVKNTSSASATACRFVGGEDAFGLTYTEVLAGGFGKTDQPFSLNPGQERTFSVSLAGSTDDYDDWAALACGNYYGTINADNLASIWGYQQRGLSANLTMTVLGSNQYKQIGISDFDFRSVIVKLVNTGEYSGEFVIRFDDDEYLTRADVTSFCVSNSSGKCISAPSSYETNIDLAPNETGYITFRVDRGNDPGTGFVYVTAKTWDEPVRSALYGGFEVVRK